MSRLSLQEKTIKMLFAKSGNQCAFPKCNQAIVEDETIIGEICHIEAANAGGQRYNPKQTDDERRREDNLILLCANHHRITNNVELYPVEKLKQMKVSHESKSPSSEYKIPDHILKELIRIDNSQENTNNISGQIENLTINQTQNIGFTKIEDIADMVLSLLNANFPRIHETAMRTASLYVEKFSRLLTAALQAEGIDVSDIEKAFIDPDMQYVFNSTIQTVARSGDQELITILNRLIISRIKNCEIESKKLFLNESILTVNKLTKIQLDMMVATFFMHDNLENLSISSWDELNSYFNTYAEKFISIKPAAMDFRHIKYTGCASFSDRVRPSYSQILKTSFPTLFENRGFQTTVRPGPVTDDNIVCEQLTLGNTLITLTMKSKLWALDLSSVGIIIAAAHAESVLAKQIDIESYFQHETF